MKQRFCTNSPCPSPVENSFLQFDQLPRAGNEDYTQPRNARANNKAKNPAFLNRSKPFVSAWKRVQRSRSMEYKSLVFCSFNEGTRESTLTGKFESTLPLELLKL